jgi:hypothetical protein
MLTELDGVEPRIAPDQGSAFGSRLAEEFCEKELRVANLSQKIGQALAHPVRSTLDGIVIAGVKPTVQDVEVRKDFDFVCLLPAARTSREVTLGLALIFGSQISPAKPDQYLLIGVMLFHETSTSAAGRIADA